MAEHQHDETEEHQATLTEHERHAVHGVDPGEDAETYQPEDSVAHQPEQTA